MTANTSSTSTYCEFCQQGKLRSSGCLIASVEVHGESVPRIPYTPPKFGKEFERCQDCNAKYGRYHHPKCEWELCPCCMHELVACGCEITGALKGIELDPVTLYQRAGYTKEEYEPLIKKRDGFINVWNNLVEKTEGRSISNDELIKALCKTNKWTKKMAKEMIKEAADMGIIYHPTEQDKKDDRGPNKMRPGRFV